MAWRMLAGVYVASGMGWIRHRGRVVILTYHRVVSDHMVRDEYIQPGMYVRGQSFEAHIAYLRKRFAIVSLDELLDLWQTNRLKSDRSYCVITFDDGWKDNYRIRIPCTHEIQDPSDHLPRHRFYWNCSMVLA